MTPSKLTLSLAALSAGAVLVLTGCGGGASESFKSGFDDAQGVDSETAPLTDDEEFLNRILVEANVAPTQGDAKLIGGAAMICDAQGSGYDRVDIAASIYDGNQKASADLSSLQVYQVVLIATEIYCPEYL